MSNPGCRYASWEDARIDRFEVTPAGLVHRDGTVLTDIAGLNCSTTDDCAVTDLAFSVDGSQLYIRMYVGEEGKEAVAAFALDAVSGALVMFSTISGNWGFAAYSLSDPAAPQVLETINFDPPDQGRFLTVDDTAERVLVVGNNHLATYAFDGTSFTKGDVLALGGAGAERRIYRGAAWAAGTNRAVATWFGRQDDDQPIGGYTILEIAADGTIVMLDDVATAGHSRVATALR